MKTKQLINALKAAYGFRFIKMYPGFKNAKEWDALATKWNKYLSKYDERAIDVVIDDISMGRTKYLSYPPSLPELCQLVSSKNESYKLYKPRIVNNNKPSIEDINAGKAARKNMMEMLSKIN